MILRSRFALFSGLAIALLAGCGGSSAPDQPAAWSAPVEVTMLAGQHHPVEIRPEEAGGLSVSWQGHTGQQAEWGWLRRSSNGTWSAVPSLPVQVRDHWGSTFVVAWTADAHGPRGVMVYDDGYRFDEATFTDTDPREDHLEPIERSGTGWSVGPDIPLRGNAGLRCAYPAEGSGEAFCIAARPNGNNTLPIMLRYRPAAGWQLGESFDLGADASTLGNYIGLRTLVRDAGGRALAVWERGPSGAGVPFHTAFHTYDPATGWSALGKIPSVLDYRMGGAAALGDGKFLLAHIVCDTDASGKTCAPAASRYEPATGWQAPVEISARLNIEQVYAGGGFGYYDKPYITPPQLYTGPAGHALALWSVENETWSAFYSPATGWAAAQRLDPLMLMTVGLRAVNIDEAGRVTAGTDAGLYRFDASSGWRQLAPAVWPQGAPLVMSVHGAGGITAVWAVRQASLQDDGKTSFFSARYE